MAEKVVSVALQAKVQGFISGMNKAKASVDDLTKAASPSKADAFGKMADKAAIAGAGIATAVGVAIKRFADFDQAMSAVQANSGATGASLEALRAQAVKLGADSQFSATEAAQGINEMAKAGVEAKDILGGGLKGSLDLAAAGQISVADAAETAATAMTQFKLSGDKVPHIADLLANSANKAQGGVGDMAQALKQAGLVAASTGLSIEETTAGLTAFAAAGLLGSDAGTSMKTMLQRLSAPTDEARAKMDELGISAYDNQGNFVGLAAVAGQLQKGMSDLTPEVRNAAMATIFGSDAVRASNVLYQEGADGINKWTKEVSESGAAAKQAAALTDNLKGDIERLGGAIDSVFIQTGSSANGGLRTLTQGLTGFVDNVAQIPGPVLMAGGALSAFALLAPKGVLAYRNYKAQLDSLGLSLEKVSAKAPRTGAALEKVGKAAKIAGAALVGMQVAAQISDHALEKFGPEGLTKDLLGSADAADALNKRIAEGSKINGAYDSSIANIGDALDVAFNPSTAQGVDNALGGFAAGLGAISENMSDVAIAKQRLAELDQALSGLVTSGHSADAALAFEQIAARASDAGFSTDQLKSKLPGYTEALAGVSNQSTLTAAGQGKMTGATEDLEGAADKAKQALDDLKAAIEGLGSPVAQQRAATRDYEAAIDNVTKGLGDQKDALAKQRLEALGITDATKAQTAAAEKWAEKQMKSIDLLDAGTEAGRTNAANLDEIAAATKTKVAADFALNESSKGTAAATDIATKAMQAGRDAYIAAAIEAGKTKTEAGLLADQLGLIPSEVAIQVKQTGAEGAGAAIDAAARDRSMTIWVTHKEAAGPGSKLGAGRRRTDLSETFQGVGGRASGGPIWGAGTKTSDSVPIWASTGEFMQKAAAVDKYGTSFMHAVNNLQFPKHLARGYRDGGEIAGSRFAPQWLSPPVASSSHIETNNSPINIAQVVTNDWAQLERDAESRRRLANLGRRRAR